MLKLLERLCIVWQSGRHETRLNPGAPWCRVAAFALPHYDEAMSFSDTVFLFFLALILFGPKKLPEMARQAGRLLAELRRASNEFKSQIETEIAHLETEKKQTVLPPSPPPQGTVASLNANTAGGDAAPPQLDSPFNPDTPSDGVIADQAISDQATPVDSSAAVSPSSTAPAEPVAEPTPPTSQESHV
jgi:sec-independent protein translocase protein TatB